MRAAILILVALPLCAQLPSTGGTTGGGSALPAQSGNSGKYLCTDGSASAWCAVVGVQGPAGPAGPVGPAGPSGADGTPGTPGYSPNAIESGCGTKWTSGLAFETAACTYLIGSTEYTVSTVTTTTLDAAHETLDRIDLIVADDTPQITKVSGVASATPSKPSLESNQVELTWAYVAAGATEPSNVASTLVYAENAGTPTEWAATVSGAGMAANSTSSPITGTYSIEATAATTGQYVQLEAAAPFNLATRNTFSFDIQSKAAWSSKRSLSIYFATDGVRVGSIVTFREGSFGYNSSVTATAQSIVMPRELFGAEVLTTTVNQLRIQVAGTQTAIGFRIDNIKLQGGVTQGTATSTLTPCGAWNDKQSYAVNCVVQYGGTSYYAKVANTNSTPSAVNANWGQMVGPIASGTATLGTTEIASEACASAVTVEATGVATTDVISWAPNADITAVTGYAPATSGGLSIYPYPTADNVNFKVCNPTGSAITPGAVTLNWRVAR